MLADADKVTARMAALDLDASQVATRMRSAGLTGTSWHWVSMAARGLWGDMPEPFLAGLAAALRCEPGELLGRPRLILVVNRGAGPVHR